MSYLNCPVCHLSLRAPRAAFMAPEHCPRCIGRRRVATKLLASPLPLRHMLGEQESPRPEAPPADRP